MFRLPIRRASESMGIEARAFLPSRAILELQQLRRLELASAMEGTTLIVLVCFAVPLKYVAGFPVLVHVMGPLHGLAFMLYAWTMVETVSGSAWRRRDVFRLALAAFVPFGGFANLRWLGRRAAEIRRVGA